MEAGLDQLMHGLAGLDISQTGASPPATSTPVGGARPKVRHSLESHKPDRDLGAELCGVTAALNQSVEKTQVSSGNLQKKTKQDNFKKSDAVFVLVIQETTNSFSNIL